MEIFYPFSTFNLHHGTSMRKQKLIFKKKNEEFTYI